MSKFCLFFGILLIVCSVNGILDFSYLKYEADQKRVWTMAITYKAIGGFYDQALYVDQEDPDGNGRHTYYCAPGPSESRESIIYYEANPATTPVCWKMSSLPHPGFIWEYQNTSTSLTPPLTGWTATMYAPGGAVPTFELVLGTPTITGIAPTSGHNPNPVVITGTNLTGATAVTFTDGISASFTVDSDTQITATVPVGATTGPITVTTPLGTATSATWSYVMATGRYNVYFPPSVGNVALAPVTGTGFSDLTVYDGGTRLRAIAGATTVYGGSGTGPTQLTGPFLEADHVAVYIAVSDADLATIDYTLMPDDNGVGGDPHLLETAPASTMSFDDIWKVFYAQNQKKFATDFVPGARNFGGSVTTPNDPTSGTDCDYLTQTENGCAMTGFWYVRNWTCGGFTYREQMWVTRSEAATFSADNDVYLKVFPFGRISNANSAIGDFRATLILPIIT